jgi:hypothetical protein
MNPALAVHPYYGIEGYYLDFKELPNTKVKFKPDTIYKYRTGHMDEPRNSPTDYSISMANRSVVRDLRYMSRDIMTLNSLGCVYADFKMSNIFIDKSGSLIIIDVDIQRKGENIVSSALLNTRNQRFLFNGSREQCLSFSYIMFIAYIVALFNNGVHGKIILSEITAKDPNHVLTLLTEYDALLYNKTQSINILEYTNYIRYLAEVYIDYCGEKRFHLLRSVIPELALVDDILECLLGKQDVFTIPPKIDERVRQAAEDFENDKTIPNIVALLKVMNTGFCKDRLARYDRIIY